MDATRCQCVQFYGNGFASVLRHTDAGLSRRGYNYRGVVMFSEILDRFGA